MEKLKIDEIESTRRGMKTMRISGFADGELAELKKMDHSAAEDKLLDMIDERNGRLGTIWHNGPGVWSTWYDNEYAYVNIGSSCD